MADPTIRYVITHIDKTTGMRTLAEPQQGRFTYATEELARLMLSAMTRANTEDRLKMFFGLPLEVRPVECWEGHFDPKTCWFDT